MSQYIRHRDAFIIVDCKHFGQKIPAVMSELDCGGIVIDSISNAIRYLSHGLAEEGQLTTYHGEEHTAHTPDI